MTERARTARADDPGRRLQAAFASKIAQGADAAEIAAMATRVLSSIAATLHPVIGRAGVAALYKRSIHLAALTHPWLSGDGDNDMSALGASLAGHPVADAAEAGTAVLQTLCELLASLIGVALTERLLHGVWTDL